MLRDPLVAPSEPSSACAAPVQRPVRLRSLDVLRGFTVLLMVFVDEIGGAYPALNHSPWAGITLADFVMPWFLFMVGTSLSISLRKFQAAQVRGTKFVAVRTVKLFALGVLLQGGDFPAPILGFNLATIRFCGILNRIAFAYIVAALIELWVPPGPALASDDRRRPHPCSPHLRLFGSVFWRWICALFFPLLHLGLTYWTYVPTWTSRYGFDNITQAPGLLPRSEGFPVVCDVRGAVDTPPCSAAGFYDRLLFGQDHLGVWMSLRLPECSACSPGAPSAMYRPSCTWQPHATISPPSTSQPNWCFARMYDPEGALATVPTVMSVWLGTHFGRALKADGMAGRHATVLAHWAVCASGLIAAGLALHYTAIPMSKQLWSTSYMLFMAGTCGATLAACYAAVDATPSREFEAGTSDRGGTAEDCSSTGGGRGDAQGRGGRFRGTQAVVRVQAVLRQLLFPLEAMGMNAILFFFWHGTAEALINAVYYDPPAPGIEDFTGGGVVRPIAASALLGESGWVHETLFKLFSDDARVRQLLFVLTKLAVYLAVAVACWRRKYFWKL
jgi:heparan-alpha-glucosaminide N-acetyltransferase